MTRIPTATRRQRVEVRASQTGPKLPSLHALPRHALPKFTAGTAKQCRTWLSPNRIERKPFHRQAEGFPPGPARPGFHPRSPMTAVSGITASGHLTLGNYLGALRRFAERTDEPGFYFVADLHAMTTRHDPKRLATLTRETELLLLAAGLPDESIFIQSAVPAHAQLAYLLGCTAYVGELSRMVQYKEKGRGKPMTRASLFTYPCLMAADILLYGADRVPVGGDQDQHVELARDLAIRFNHTYGQTFVVPELHRATTAGRVRDLLTPTAKMSTRAPDEAAGVLRMLDSPDVLRRKVMRAVTDSDGTVPHDEGAKPGGFV